MKIKYLKESDYDILVGWWKFWRFGVVERDFLPENGTGGIMLYTDNDIPICAGFLYFTNSKVAWLEFIISNPEYKENDRKVMLNALIDQLVETAIESGYKYVYTSVKHPSLIARFKDCGFLVGTQNATEMVYVK